MAGRCGRKLPTHGGISGSAGAGKSVYSDGTSRSSALAALAGTVGAGRPRQGGALIPLPRLRQRDGRTPLAVCICRTSVMLSTGKAVSYLVLPGLSGGVRSGEPAIQGSPWRPVMTAV
jgi:hypothetical protein